MVRFHVPFLIARPDVPGGGRTDALASSVDIAPTLLEIAGVDANATATRYPALKGHSPLPVLHGRPVRQGTLNAVESVDHDARAWVTERPQLLGWPTWHGDDHRPETLTAQGR
ncbi:hypothetical protein ACFXPI_05195 [Streptomyces sp. NPDC059104]|uniref:hypothetical protein n=1 Tax=Streptomyces sp. NPDC059104 TaxID=3346729 RepID=UPI00367C0A1E